MSCRIARFVALFIGVISHPVLVSGYQFQTVEELVQQMPDVHFSGTPFYRPTGTTDEANTFGAVYGTTLATGPSPKASALAFIDQVSTLLGDDWGTLEIQKQHNGEELLPVMVDPANNTPRFYTFRFNQVYQGLPVLRSGIGFLVRNEPGFPVVMSGIEVRHLPGFEVGAIDTESVEVTEAMLTKVTELMDLGTERGLKSLLKMGQNAIEVTDEKLVIYAGVDGKTDDPQIAVQFVATRGSVQSVPDYRKYLIVASRDTGEILVAENQIVNVDITGSVQGRATTGLATLECEPEAAVGLPYAQVSVDGGATVFADANGNFTIPHSGSSPVTVRSSLRGSWFRVLDQSQLSSTPEITSVITPPGPANFLHNPDADVEFSTSNVNGYLEANVIRDFTLSYQPTFPVIGTQAQFRVNTNINDACNAYYDGVSINFFIAGLGCFNTSMSDIVYHEYGHHLVNVTDNGQGAFGEGAGDVMGLLIQDEPILAYGFSGNCNAGLRTADNTLQYPCSGEIHFCGQLLSGAIWDTRHELALTEPADYRDINSSLFLGMLMVRGQMRPFDDTIDPFITVVYLQLDDDDANIDNGTPHYNEIAAGFGLHNLDAPPLTLLEFAFPTGRPEMVPHNGGVAFNLQVTASSQDPIPGSGRMYLDTGSGFQLHPMTEISPNLYQVSFPATSCGQTLRYYFMAEAEGGIDQFEPVGAPAAFYSAIAATSIRTGFSDNFETDTGWFDVSTAFDGTWDRGFPAGNGSRGDPTVDGDGSGRCFLTGNFAGNSDVDDGYTWLASPIMDATTTDPDEIPMISYMRWYDNSKGDDPENDVFVVELSNNGGATFTVLETVGPSGPEVHGGWVEKSFRISDFVTPTNQMRIVFKASDEGLGSIVEAAVDAVAIKFLKCDHAEPEPVMEIGQITDLTHEWKTINLGRSFVDPVIILGAPSTYGGNPSTLGVNNVTSNSFDVAVVEWNYLDVVHGPETVSYMVVEAGVHTLADGTKIAAGKDSVKDNFKFISYGTTFSATPVVFTQRGTLNGLEVVTTRHKDISTTGFKVHLREEEANNQIHPFETVYWFAIDTGIGISDTGNTFEAGLTGTAVSHKNFNLLYNQVYAGTPAFFAQAQSYLGGDPIMVRHRVLTNTSAKIFLEEEKSLDDEIIHGKENVGYLAVETGLFLKVAESNGAIAFPANGK